MATGSERDRRKSSSRRLFTKGPAAPYSLFDRDPTAEVLFDFRHKQDSVFSRYHPDEATFLELSTGQLVKVNLGLTQRLQSRELLFGQSLAPEGPESGCFPRNYVLPSAIPRIRQDELRMETFLGDGGFGRVYRHVYKERMVAVKETVHRVTVDLLKEVNHEATILAKLSGLGREAREDSHVNVCRLLGVMVEIPFRQYSLVLEYCAGGELYSLLHERKIRLDNYSLVLNYCTQIAEGLEYMHTALDIPIIHRDLKTKNVLLLRDVDPSDPRTLETNTLKLIDFGLARELAKTHLTTDKGTYVYMSPEAMMFNRHSEQSDIWSLGVVLWEVLVQVFPYPNIPEILVLLGVAKGLVSLPLPDTFPPDFRKLLQKCLMLDSERRGDISRVVKELKAMQRHREPLPPDTFLALREEWQLAAESIEVNQTEILSVSVGGNSSSSRETATATTQRESQILDLKSSLTMGDPDINIEEEITKTQTEILDLRNNFQFSQVAQVALAVTKFKKMAEIRKPPAGDSVSVEQTQQPQDKANTCAPIESLGSVITREKLDNLELKFKLRQLQLELDRTKQQVLDGQKRRDGKRRRFNFRPFSRNTTSFDTVGSPLDSDLSRTVSSQKPRSKSFGLYNALKSRFSQPRPRAPVPPVPEEESGLALSVPQAPVPASSAPASPDPAGQLELPPLEAQIRLSFSNNDLAS